MNNVVCVNVGTKYPKEYTERLYNMVERNTTIPFNFYVITDAEGRYEEPIHEIVIPDAEPSWWSKLLMFKKGVLPDGNYLYLDLDVVVVSNIDHYFNRDRFSIIRDFIRPDEGLMGNKEYNSSVMFFNNAKFAGLYDWYKANESYWKGMQEKIHFFGDQNVVSEYLNHYPDFCNPFPDEEIWSLKKGHERGKWAGQRRGEFIGKDIPPKGTICVFHGEPNPTQVDIDWVKENYR